MPSKRRAPIKRRTVKRRAPIKRRRIIRGRGGIAPPDQWTGNWKNAWDSGEPYIVITQQPPPPGQPMFKAGAPKLSPQQRTQIMSYQPLWLNQWLQRAGW